MVAAELGADALGFIFHANSPRAIEVSEAAAIVARLPPFVTTVGVFVDAPTSFIEDVLRAVPLGLLQFHGDECPADCSAFARPYIKAVPMAGEVSVTGYMATYVEASGFVLDSHGLGRTGGTGETFDWSRFPKDSGRPVILAGGLGPLNVADAVLQTRPWAVDVSSGVERSAGVKDISKMAAFIEEVQRVDSK